jgi:hypothetical protein
MNTEIVRELARQWRKKAESRPCRVDEQQRDASYITETALEAKIDEAVQDTLRYCSQELEDVIRIYDYFNGTARPASVRDEIRKEVKPYALQNP